jgi:hypothetical protein
MPKPRRTAMRSTGGKSERMAPPKKRPSEDVHMTSPPPPEQVQRREIGMSKRRRGNVTSEVSNAFIEISPPLTHLQWCFSCVNGGELLTCELCDRSICHPKCVTLPVELDALKESDFAFACPTCHTDYFFKEKKTYRPYFVSSISSR